MFCSSFRNTILFSIRIIQPRIYNCFHFIDWKNPDTIPNNESLAIVQAGLTRIETYLVLATMGTMLNVEFLET